MPHLQGVVILSEVRRGAVAGRTQSKDPVESIRRIAQWLRSNLRTHGVLQSDPHRTFHGVLRLRSFVAPLSRIYAVGAHSIVDFQGHCSTALQLGRGLK